MRIRSRFILASRIRLIKNQPKIIEIKILLQKLNYFLPEIHLKNVIKKLLRLNENFQYFWVIRRENVIKKIEFLLFYVGSGSGYPKPYQNETNLQH